MHILITGATGRLGRDLARVLSRHDVTPLSHADLDVAVAPAVDAAFERQSPEAVLHCAAMTDTGRCEREPDSAYAANATGSQNVARACARTGARLIVISTNEVFDGAASTPYIEDSPLSAINAYGRTKAEGERLALQAYPATSIVRTSWLYGAGAGNFIEKVRAIARERRPLRMVTDEISAPTSTVALAKAIGELLDAGAPSGIYHLANEGEASRYDWAREILRLDGLDVPVEAVTTPQLRAEGYAGPLKPPYSVLANNNARALGITMRPWQETLADHFAAAKVAADG